MKSTANISQKLYQVKGSHCGGCKAKIEAHLLGLTDVQVAEMDLATKRLSVVGSIDPRVRKLADNIIEAQRLEIAEMKALIADLEGGPTATPEIDGK